MEPYPNLGIPPQNDVRYAGFWLRAIAASLDVLVLIVPMIIIDFSSTADLRRTELGQTLFGIAETLNFILGWLYFTILESSNWQATLGKKAVGIKVTDMQGKKIGFVRANVRYWSQILSAIILMIGYLMAAFTKKKQGLHDMIASTLVVKKD